MNRLLSALARVALVIPLLACGATPRVPAAARAQELPWIRDDAPRALAEAKRSGKPLFVEFGAAWCKACVSMGEYAFQDPALIEELGERAVWLSVDIENPANAPFVEAHRHKNYPTFTVLGSGAEQSWTGYFQAEEFISVFRVALLGDAEALHQQELRYAQNYRSCAEIGAAPVEDALVALARATTAATCQHTLWWKGEVPNTTDTHERLQAALARALQEGGSPSLAGRGDAPFFIHAAYEALFLDADGPSKAAVGAAWRQYAERLPVVARARAHRVSGDAAGAVQLLEEYTQVRRAPEQVRRAPEQVRRAPEQVRRAPEQVRRAREHSEEFEAFRELAEAYLELRHFDAEQAKRGLAASDRALALGRGPSLLPVYWTKAYLAHHAGDDALANRILDEARARASVLPLSRGGAELANRIGRLRDNGF